MNALQVFIRRLRDVLSLMFNDKRIILRQAIASLRDYGMGNVNVLLNKIIELPLWEISAACRCLPRPG